jgi:hypothetical protein
VKHPLRRWAAPLLLVYAHVLAVNALAQQQRLDGSAGSRPAEMAEQRLLLDQGEARLAAGDAEEARWAFEQAARLAHTADIELSLVRAYMQAGQYRNALAFCAHAAGAHPEVPAGTALYAWLLHIGGQGRVAATTLAGAAERAPGDPMLSQAGASLSGPWPAAFGVLAEGPWRAAPYAWGATVPGTARVLGSGVLIDGGRAALVPTRLLDEAQRVWVRNGLGQTSEANIEQRLVEVPLTLVRLAQPLAPPPPLQRAAREPFGGSPGYTIEYALGPGAVAAWPLLRQGFFGSVPRDGGLRPLGIDVPPGPRGGPALDVSGRLTGLAIADAEGRNRLLPIAALPAELSPLAGPVAETSNSRMPLDEIYERGLFLALQVIVLR